MIRMPARGPGVVVLESVTRSILPVSDAVSETVGGTVPRMGRAAVSPMPPVADASMPWDVDTPDPVADLAAARSAHGETFVVDSGDDRFLFLFSPAGVRAFYGVAEEDASKGVADWRMLRRKVPPELFDGRRTLPHDLFGRTEADVQSRSLAIAIPRMMDTIADGDEIDVFGFTRVLGHLVGLTSWGGAELADHDRLDELIGALDSLDAAEAFVHPGLMAEIAAAGHVAERRAIETAEEIIGDVIRRRREVEEPGDDLLGSVIESWRDADGDVGTAGAARDVILVHLASMSNLFAAIGWTIVDVVQRPVIADRIRDGDHDLTSRCALESIRRAQRSVMMRYVLRPLTVDTEDGAVDVEPGVTLATLLPLTNRSAAPGLDDFDPDRWTGRRLGPHTGLAATELVTTFGHGSHRCPAQAFSLRAITTTLEGLLARFDLELVDADPRPVPGQIGGVARADGPCRVRMSER